MLVAALAVQYSQKEAQGGVCSVFVRRILMALLAHWKETRCSFKAGAHKAFNEGIVGRDPSRETLIEPCDVSCGGQVVASS